MAVPVRLENDALRVEVWPKLGGKVSSMIDKADRFELMFNYPAEIPLTSQYGRPFESSWYAGWDECLPAVAPGGYPGHPYDHIQIPDHGELWGLPTTATPTKDGITTTWHGLRFGYRLDRRLWLDGASVVAEYTLTNLAPFEFRYVWAMHALLSLASPTQIEFAGMDGRPFRLSHDASGNELGEVFPWPRGTSGGQDFSRPAELAAGAGWKIFSTDAIAGPATVRYPERGRKLTLDYIHAGDAADTDLADSVSDLSIPPTAYWGLWVNTGGWRHHKHIALEPTTGRFDQLARSVRDGSAGRVRPLGRTAWRVRLTSGKI